MSWLSPCSVDTYEELYAYQYRPKPSENLRQSSGWALYDPLNEYGRMGVPNELWTHTTLNRNYEVHCMYIWCTRAYTYMYMYMYATPIIYVQR